MEDLLGLSPWQVSETRSAQNMQKQAEVLEKMRREVRVRWESDGHECGANDGKWLNMQPKVLHVYIIHKCVNNINNIYIYTMVPLGSWKGKYQILENQLRTAIW